MPVDRGVSGVAGTAPAQATAPAPQDVERTGGSGGALRAGGRGNGVRSAHEVFRANVSREIFIDGVAHFYDVVLPDITTRAEKGERVAIVFDIDNTLFDTRYRTLEAARRYGQEQGIALLANASLEDIGTDGADTCARLGIGAGPTSDGFQAFWGEHFWDPASFTLDRGITRTLELLRDAKEAGAEIFYLTGRIDRYREATLAQLGALPDGDDAHLITKPKLGVRTDRFKAKKLRNGLDTDPPASVVAFVSEGRRDLRHIQRNTTIRTLWFDFPVDREGYALARGTPAIPW